MVDDRPGSERTEEEDGGEHSSAEGDPEPSSRQPPSPRGHSRRLPDAVGRFAPGGGSRFHRSWLDRGDDPVLHGDRRLLRHRGIERCGLLRRRRRRPRRGTRGGYANARVLPDRTRDEQRPRGGGIARRSCGRRRRSRGRVPGSGDLQGIRVDRRPVPVLYRGTEQPGEEARHPLGCAGKDDAAQVLLHLARVRVPPLAILGERLGEDRIERRERGIELARRRRLGALDGFQGEDDVRLVEGVLPAEHLVERDADGEDVAALVERLRQRLLRAHVDELALDHPRFGLDGGDLALGDAEVDDLDVAAEAEQHVLRIQVAVDDVEASAGDVGEVVRVARAVADLLGDGASDLRRDALLAPARRVDHLAQRLPRHVLHGDEVRALVLPELEHLHDVAVVHPRRETRLAEEQLDELLVLGEVVEDLLDDEDLLEAGRPLLASEEYLPHSAGGQLLQEKIFAVISADPGHRLRHVHHADGPPRDENCAGCCVVDGTVR